MYCKSCAKKLFFEKFKEELYVKVMCTVKVMMRFYVSEHVCYKLYTKLYLQVITFQRKKLWSKNHFQKGNRTVCRRPRAGIARRALISIGPCGRALLISGRSPEAMRASNVGQQQTFHFGNFFIPATFQI